MGFFDRFKKKTELEDRPFTLTACVSGNCIPLSDVKDDVIASGALGIGVGIEPQENKIVAPVGGQVVMVFPTHHAVGIKTENGVEILIHAGLDTVELEGTPFCMKVKQGDHVVRGQEMFVMDCGLVKKMGKDTTVMMLVTNHEKYPSIHCYTGKREQNDIVMEIES